MKEKILKNTLICGAGAVLSIIPVMGYYPFIAPAVAAIICSYAQRIPGIILMMLSVYLRMTGLNTAKYTLIILVIAGVLLLVEEKNTRSKVYYGAVIASISVLIMEGTDVMMLGMRISRADAIILGGLVVATFCGTIVFNRLISLVLSMGKSIDTGKKRKKKEEIKKELSELESRLENMSKAFARISRLMKETEDNMRYNYLDERFSCSLQESFLNEKIRENKNILQMYLKETGKIFKNLAEQVLEEEVSKDRVKNNYFMLHGMAKKSLDKKVNGDNFTCINLDNGQTLLSISDGMGTGEDAARDSSVAVEIIEEFMNCGFSEEFTMKLVNSLFVTKDSMNPATVDMSIIDMNSGVCDILKSGAATTYVKRRGWVEAIKSTSLPLGVSENVDMETTKKKLYDGEFVIMMSDGLTESIIDEDKDKIIGDIILSLKSKKPRDMAWEILNKVTERTSYFVQDDMTVLVTGIWDKIA